MSFSLSLIFKHAGSSKHGGVYFQTFYLREGTFEMYHRKHVSFEQDHKNLKHKHHANKGNLFYFYIILRRHCSTM